MALYFSLLVVFSLCFLSQALLPQINSTAIVEGCKLGKQTGCSSDVAAGLTKQILNKMQNMGYDFTTLNSDWIKCTSPCVNQLQSAAATHLKDAAKSKNDYIRNKIIVLV